MLLFAIAVFNVLTRPGHRTIHTLCIMPYEKMPNAKVKTRHPKCRYQMLKNACQNTLQTTSCPYIKTYL